MLLHMKLYNYTAKNIKYAITMIPSTIRYQPNTLKSCFLMYPIKNLIAKIETKKATNVPVPSVIASAPVKSNPNFTIFSKLAPNMTGIAKKNVNSEAT